MLQIHAVFGAPVSENESELSLAVNRIVRQNVASKVTAVSSWQWACMLRAIAGTDEGH